MVEVEIVGRDVVENLATLTRQRHQQLRCHQFALQALAQPQAPGSQSNTLPRSPQHHPHERAGVHAFGDAKTERGPIHSGQCPCRKQQRSAEHRDEQNGIQAFIRLGKLAPQLLPRPVPQFVR
jgi:hypothetical protein